MLVLRSAQLSSMAADVDRRFPGEAAFFVAKHYPEAAKSPDFANQLRNGLAQARAFGINNDCDAVHFVVLLAAHGFHPPAEPFLRGYLRQSRISSAEKVGLLYSAVSRAARRQGTGGLANDRHRRLKLKRMWKETAAKFGRRVFGSAYTPCSDRLIALLDEAPWRERGRVARQLVGEMSSAVIRQLPEATAKRLSRELRRNPNARSTQARMAKLAGKKPVSKCKDKKNPAQANFTKLGLQLVLLQCWGKNSLKRLLGVIGKLNKKKISVIEIGLSPFLDCICTPVPANSRFDNLNSIANAIRKKGVEVRVVLHLGAFHLGGTKEKCSAADLSTNMRETWSDFIVPRLEQADVSFHISPSLEDEVTDQGTYNGYLAELLKAILTDEKGKADTAAMDHLTTLVNGGRFLFRRSNNHGKTAPAVSDSSFPDVPTIDVISEIHNGGGKQPCSAGVWSNDGDLVYADKSENHAKHEVIAKDADRVSLSDTIKNDAVYGCCKKGKTAGSRFKLLWRPAYNLCGYEYADKDKKTKIFLNPPDKLDSESPDYRSLRDDSSGGFFDDFEAAVVKKFFGIR